jgi:hypothetical protein
VCACMCVGVRVHVCMCCVVYCMYLRTEGSLLHGCVKVLSGPQLNTTLSNGCWLSQCAVARVRERGKGVVSGGEYQLYSHLLNLLQVQRT